MISAFESTARRFPQSTCFTHVDEAGFETSYSYRETRMLSAALAYCLSEKGVRQRDCITVDLPNCPAFVFLTLAAAYGGYTLIVLNSRLTVSEKLTRILEVERDGKVRIALRIDATNIKKLMKQAEELFSGEALSTREHARSSRSTAFRNSAANAQARSTRALGRAETRQDFVRRREAETRQEAIEVIINYASRATRMFDGSARALVMFTSGTTGRAKAASLTWDNLCASAQISNDSLNRQAEVLWQLALPLFHIGGFQIVVRSFLQGNSFVLYQRFDATRLLEDAAYKNATHISVVDKMLQDMLASPRAEALSRYHCILLGGSRPNPQTLERALLAQARVYVSYGMTETSSQVAYTRLTPSYVGGLRLLPGYEAHIVGPDEQGFGRLAIKGPGLFEGYLNARGAYTVDGFFLTGDTAALYQGKIYLKERTKDMFVSGGENIYPAEIRDKILRLPGVSDTYVFSVEDATWGRRPIALVERDNSTAPQLTNPQFAKAIQAKLHAQLSKLYLPDCICALNEFPRTGVGKTAATQLELLYHQRIEVKKVTLHRIRLPFKKPFKTAKETLTHRESIIVEVTDHAGRTGLGECVAFETDWYLPETLEQDAYVLKEVLAPLILNTVMLHPSEASGVFASYQRASSFPLACGALEPALWDLYGKIVGKPLWQLIGGVSENDTSSASLASHASSQKSVSAGAVLGLGTPKETATAAINCAKAGYRRVKLKVKPGHMLEHVHAVRKALPHIAITLDANQSFTEDNREELRALDKYRVAWIEEPLDSGCMGKTASAELLERLVRLQKSLRTPVCLDESIVSPADFVKALGYKDLRTYAIKIAKLGGVKNALDFVFEARSHGIDVWMGGMYDTGISKRLHAAFETLGVTKAPGDIGSTSHYFSQDITNPPYEAHGGQILLNTKGYEYGLGCSLNQAVLDSVLVSRTVIS